MVSDDDQWEVVHGLFKKTHYWTSKIQDDGRVSSWISLNHHMSTKNHPILMKRGTQQILNSMTVTRPKWKLLLFKMAVGRHIKNLFWP